MLNLMCDGVFARLGSPDGGCPMTRIDHNTFTNNQAKIIGGESSCTQPWYDAVCFLYQQPHWVLLAHLILCLPVVYGLG